MRLIRCSLLLALVMMATAGLALARPDEIPTFQYSFGQPAIEPYQTVAGYYWGIAEAAPPIAADPSRILIGGPDVSCFDRQGTYQRFWPLTSWNEGQLDPIAAAWQLAPKADDLAIGPSGEVYALDADYAAILRYDADGDFGWGWGRPQVDTSPQPSFVRPTALSVAPDGTVYVLDQGMGRIWHFDQYGDRLNLWSTPVADAADAWPVDIAAAVDDGVWLLNTTQGELGTEASFRVYHYVSGPAEVASWPVPADATAPAQAIETDAAGRVWVLGTGTLWCYDSSGTLLTELATTAERFCISSDDRLHLLVPQDLRVEPHPAGSYSWKGYVIEERSFDGTLLRATGTHDDMKERGTLAGAYSFAVSAAGDTWARVDLGDVETPFRYVLHYGPDGQLLEMLDTEEEPVSDPTTGEVSLTIYPGPVKLGPDGRYYDFWDIQSSDIVNEDGVIIRDWCFRIYAYDPKGGATSEMLLVTPSDMHQLGNGVGCVDLAFGPDGNMRLALAVYLTEWDPDDPQDELLWVGTVTPHGEVVSSWTQKFLSEQIGAVTALAVDPESCVYLGGERGLWKFSPTGTLLGRIGQYSVPWPDPTPRGSLVRPDPKAMALDAAGRLFVLDDDANRIDVFTYTPGPFPDVPWWHWARDAVRAVVDAGIVSGYPGGNYRPTEAVTRGQLAVYLARALEGGDADVPSGPATATFSDVPVGHWAFPYVEDCVSRNIVVGYGGSYHPDEPVDRAQMSVYLVRSVVDPTGDDGLAGYTGPATPSFTDVTANFWAYRYIEYAKAHWIVQGYWDNTYHPEREVTRDQMAVYVARAFQLSM